MDNGNDDDLPYGPWLKGTRLPTNSYDRYRTDFSKANAWPLLTRLARQSLVSAVPRLSSPNNPQPNSLHDSEKASTITISRPPLAPTTTQNLISPLPPSTLSLTTSPPAITTAFPHSPYMTDTPPSSNLNNRNNKGKNILGAPFIPNSILPNPSSTDIPSNSTTFTNPQPSVTVADFTHIYVPDLGHGGMSHNVFATYSPLTSPTFPTPSLKSLSISTTTQPTTSISVSTPALPSSLSHDMPTDYLDKENTPPSATTKRQSEPVSMRKFLKRCRGVGSQSTSFFTPESHTESLVSSNEDSIDSLDCPAMVALQPRHSS
ncbi:hypothetical protein CsatB_008479 [Cannabis sativa]